MKKVIAIVLCLALLLTIVACATDELDTPVVTESPVATATPTTAPTEAPTATTSPTEAPVETTTTPTYNLKINSSSSSSSGSSSDTEVEPTPITWADLLGESFTWSDDAYFVSDTTDASSVGSISNDTYSGEIEFDSFELSAKTTINMPNATLTFNDVSGEFDLDVTSGENTAIFKGTANNKNININGGNVVISGQVDKMTITDQSSSDATKTTTITIQKDEDSELNPVVTELIIDSQGDDDEASFEVNVEDNATANITNNADATINTDGTSNVAVTNYGTAEVNTAGSSSTTVTNNADATISTSGYSSVDVTNTDATGATVSVSADENSTVSLTNNNEESKSASVDIPVDSEANVEMDGSVELTGGTEASESPTTAIVSTSDLTSQVVIGGVIYDGQSTKYATVSEALVVSGVTKAVLLEDITDATDAVTIASTQTLDTNGYNYATTGGVTNYGTIKVGTQTSFDSAISAGGVIEVSKGDFTAPIEITKSTTIIGAGSTRLSSTNITTLNFSAPLEIKTNGVVFKLESLDIDADTNISGFTSTKGIISLGSSGTTIYSGIELYMTDCQVITETTGTLTASISLDATDGAKVVLDNSYIFGKYAIYCASYTDSNNVRGASHDITDTEYTITNSTLEGWATGNMRGEETVFNISDSILIGTNTYSGISNEYASFVMTDGAINGTYTFNRCTIISSNTGDQPQSGINLQYGAQGNTIYLNDCVFEQNDYGDVTSYNIKSSSNGTGTYLATENNKVVVNNVEYETPYEHIYGEFTGYNIENDSLVVVERVRLLTYKTIADESYLWFNGTIDGTTIDRVYDIFVDEKVIVSGVLYEIVNGTLIRYDGLVGDNEYTELERYVIGTTTSYTFKDSNGDTVSEAVFDTATLLATAGETVTIDSDTAKEILLNDLANSTLTINCDLIIDTQLSLYNTGSIIVSETGSITINEGGTLYMVTKNQTMTNNGTIINNGTVKGFGVLSKIGDYSGSGIISVSASDFDNLKLLISDDNFKAASSTVYVLSEMIITEDIDIPQRMLLDISENMVINEGVVVDVYGSFELYYNESTNNGTINVKNGGALWVFGATLTNLASGIINIDESSSMTLGSDYIDYADYNTNEGTSNSNLFFNAYVENNGTINNYGNIYDDGAYVYDAYSGVYSVDAEGLSTRTIKGEISGNGTIASTIITIS